MTDHCGPGRRKSQAGRAPGPGGDAGQGAGRRGGDDHAALCPYGAGGAALLSGACLAALLGELNQIQDHQNQILAELLRALERVAAALEAR